MVIVASLCGADDWPQIVAVCNSMVDWIAQFVDVSSGIPSIYTFKRIFAVISPNTMNKLLISVARAINEFCGADIINFDGKTLRGTRDDSSGLEAIHLLNAWSTKSGLCIGQLDVEEKSNEITAMPKLMQLLDLKGSIITSDALNTQKTIVKQAVEQEADYVLPVKGNHPGLKEEVKTIINDAIENPSSQQLFSRRRIVRSSSVGKREISSKGRTLWTCT